MKQVDKQHYGFLSYAHPDRFVSYFHQLKEIHEVSPQSVLEIGVGDGVVGNYLRDNTLIKYTSIDIAEDVNPDVIGSVLELPFENDTHDVVCAFEVLEHIPFDQFEKAVKEMARVAKSYVMISVPHFGPPIKFLIKLPFLPELKFAIKIPYHPKHVFNGQHYWELGKKGYTRKAVLSVLEKYGNVEKEFIPFENQYHHFFIVSKDMKKNLKI